MAAYVGKALREQMAARNRHEREMRGMRREREMVEVPFEWHAKQTDKAVLFPSYGWVPTVAIRWRKPDGQIVPWSSGHNATDAFLLAKEFAERKPKEG